MKSLVLVATAATALGATPPAKASDQAERLMAEMRAAMTDKRAAQHDSYHETGTHKEGDGKSGAYDTWGDLRGLRYTNQDVFNGKATLTGFDGRQAWRVDPDGKLHVSTKPERLSQARLETYVILQGYLYPERFDEAVTYRGNMEDEGETFDVVTVTPKDALSVDLWLDARTHKVRRLSASAGAQRLVGKITSYRRIDGVDIPWTGTQKVGDWIEEEATASYDFAKVPPERFSPPPS